MNKFINKTRLVLALTGIGLFQSILIMGQSTGGEIMLSGARFTNAIFEYWIVEYQKEHPGIKIRIENKGAQEYANADIIVHGLEPDKSEMDKKRKYIPIAKCAIVPVANAESPFARIYGEKGLDREEIKQVFFYDPIEQEEKKPIKTPFTVYTRVQKAPSPTVFASNFGYEQQDLHGRAIAGADIHLIKSILRDPQGITYAPISLIYSSETGKPLEGLQVIPVDFDDNGKVSADERFYHELSIVLKNLENSKSKNIPVADIWVSILRETAKPEAIQFLQWVLDKGQVSLKQYGYLNPEPKALQKDRSLLDQMVLNQP